MHDSYNEIGCIKTKMIVEVKDALQQNHPSTSLLLTTNVGRHYEFSI